MGAVPSRLPAQVLDRVRHIAGLGIDLLADENGSEYFEQFLTRSALGLPDAGAVRSGTPFLSGLYGSRQADHCAAPGRAAFCLISCA
jgi:hypothetical protein